MNTSLVKYPLLLAAALLLLLIPNQASAQCCGANKQFSMNITIDGLTASTEGPVTQGKLAPIRPGEELNIDYQIEVVSGSYGEQPSLICQLNQKVLVNKQEEAPGGGSFPFYMPTTPGTYYFSCSLTNAGSIPQIALVVP